MRETTSKLNDLKTQYPISQLGVKKVSLQKSNKVLLTSSSQKIKLELKQQNNTDPIFNPYCTEYKQIPKLDSTYNRQTLYDAINFLYSHFINTVSNLILNAKYVNVFCSKDVFEISSEFLKKLLSFGVCGSIYCLDTTENSLEVNAEQNSLFIFIDINNDETSIFKLPQKGNSTVVIKNHNKHYSTNKLESTLSINLHKPQIKNLSEKDKFKIFLNCIYINILSKKL